MRLKILLVICTFAWQFRGSVASVQASLFSNSCAIVVGVNTYASSTWPHLNYAVKDANGMAEFLRTQGFEVIKLVDSNATKQAIVSAVEDQLAGKLALNDRVLFFFAGHGTTRSLGDQSRGYLVPYDGTDSFATLITMNEIRDFSSAMSMAKHQLFILDACFGGLIATRGSTVDPRTPNYVDEITTRRARQVLTAGGANQRVMDSGPGGHSLFTGQLLKALQEGMADRNGDGIITFTELASYIQAAASQYNQTPGVTELPGHEQGDFIFADLSRKTLGPELSDRTFRSSVDVYTFLKTGKRLFSQKLYDKAIEQFQKAAEMGNAEAMAYLGKLYFDGLGTQTNEPKAIGWLKAGAEKGDTIAMQSLIHIYLPHAGSPVTTLPDPVEVNRWESALKEAEKSKLETILVDPSNMAGKDEPHIPAKDVIAAPPLPPTNLRVE